MTETIKFKAKPRKDLGTRAARRLREAGQLPAVIYGHNEPVETVSLEGHEVESALAHGARTLDVALGRRTQRCLIKEVQHSLQNQSYPLFLTLIITRFFRYSCSRASIRSRSSISCPAW